MRALGRKDSAESALKAFVNDSRSRQWHEEGWTFRDKSFSCGEVDHLKRDDPNIDDDNYIEQEADTIRANAFSNGRNCDS